MKRLCIVLVLLVLAGCQTNPLVRSLTWFRTLDGDDIRASCAAGGPDWYRFVYNADYEEQVRTYDLRRAGEGGAELVVTVSRAPNLVDIRLDDPLGPWRPAVTPVKVSGAPLEALIAAADRDLARPAPVGQNLPSYGYYWVMVACRDGAVTWKAWLHPMAGFADLAAPERLFALDPVAIPVRQPREVGIGPEGGIVPRGRSTRDERRAVLRTFNITVGANGLAGYP